MTPIVKTGPWPGTDGGNFNSVSGMAPALERAGYTSIAGPRSSQMAATMMLVATVTC